MPKKPDIYDGDNPRELLLYTIPDAARIVRVGIATARRWAVARRSRRLSFAALVELYVENASKLTAASASGRAHSALVERLLERIERDGQGLAIRLFPITRSDGDCPRSILIDPTRRFGRPVLASANIETTVVAERFLAGESPGSLAIDFRVDETDVHEAVRFESQFRAA